MEEILKYVKEKHPYATINVQGFIIFVHEGKDCKHYDINHLKYLLETKQLS